MFFYIAAMISPSRRDRTPALYKPSSPKSKPEKLLVGPYRLFWTIIFLLLVFPKVLSLPERKARVLCP